MKLYLLRHGESEANAAGINQGQTPGKLTNKGEWQAARAAERLKDEKFDLIIVSDLNRTRQTAAPIILTHPEARVIHEPRIRERHQGEFEGSPLGSFRKHVERLGADIQTYRPEGGESIAMVKERAKAFLSDLIEEHRGKTVLLVSHGGFLSQLLFLLLGKESSKENYDLLHPKNCELSAFTIDEKGKHEASLINSSDHLR